MKKITTLVAALAAVTVLLIFQLTLQRQELVCC